MKLKGCSCRLCRAGRHSHHDITRRKVKAARRNTKAALRKGQYAKLRESVAIGYTD